MADEIAYCANDLENTLAQNFFTIDEFLHRLSRLKFDNSSKIFEDWVKESINEANKTHNNDDFEFYFSRILISKIVNNLIADISIIKVDDKEKKKQAP